MIDDGAPRGEVTGNGIGPADAVGSGGGGTLHLVLTAAAVALEVDRVDPDDNFFEQGGDSLAALELAAHLEDALQREVDFELIFDSASFRELAEQL